jgi:hypothetical protein
VKRLKDAQARIKMDDELRVELDKASSKILDSLYMLLAVLERWELAFVD